MKFYSSVESMRAHPPQYSDPFIVQWELPIVRNDVERKYIVFDGVTEYMKMLSNGKYTSCHEVFLSQTYNTDDDIVAHPVFDLDSKPADYPTPSLSEDDLLLRLSIPHQWKVMMQEDILNILCKQYPTHSDAIRSALSIHSEKSYDTGALYNPWVWMSSPSLEKLSKHLTITGICFGMWRVQMNILVDDLLSLDRPYTRAIDKGILRRLGSLRLPMNHKRHIYDESTLNTDRPVIVKHSPVLKFDDPVHRFTDGLAIVHDSNIYTMKESILLSPSDLSSEYQYKMDTTYGIYNMPELHGNIHDVDYDNDEDSSDELVTSFNRINKIYNTGLIPGQPKGRYLPLVRKLPGKCPISSKIHNGDNAYIFKKGGKVYYSCHRGCSIKIDSVQRKYIDITIWKGNGPSDNARLANEDVNKMRRLNDE